VYGFVGVRNLLINIKWDKPVKQQVCATLICGQFLVEFYIAVMPDEPVQWIILSYSLYIHHLYEVWLTLTYNTFIVTRLTSITSRTHNTKFWQRDTWHQTKGIFIEHAVRQRGNCLSCVCIILEGNEINAQFSDWCRHFWANNRQWWPFWSSVSNLKRLKISKRIKFKIFLHIYISLTYNIKKYIFF